MICSKIKLLQSIDNRGAAVTSPRVPLEPQNVGFFSRATELEPVFEEDLPVIPQHMKIETHCYIKKKSIMNRIKIVCQITNILIS